MLLLLVLLSISGSPRAEAGEIIGGHEAKPHSRPYMVYLKVYDREPYSPRRCGGFLIRKDVVLTAAHCHGSTINVTLGAHNIQHKEDSQQVILMSKAIPHPDYDARIFSNDIMLLKGDSGGPLVCDNVAQGIVAYGKNNGSPPQVFTRISSFLPWIKKTLRKI
ncbi:granzyme B-like isoform X2 [Sorex araneus]|uniref:granzyme B-like isoform X2 n=1 Tax=Sorex araneus TaxID=42254 RepID=UPI0024334889|nr:granzyme B-like isoform X2 [Sorex araneus]